MRAMIIGSRLNQNKESNEPLWPLDKGSGQRLFEISGMSLINYLDTFERVNAETSPLVRDADVIVCGKDAWKMLGLPRSTDFWETHWDGDSNYALIPHPSGRNRLYNDPRARERVKVIMRMISLCSRSRTNELSAY